MREVWFLFFLNPSTFTILQMAQKRSVLHILMAFLHTHTHTHSQPDPTDTPQTSKYWLQIIIQVQRKIVKYIKVIECKWLFFFKKKRWVGIKGVCAGGILIPTPSNKTTFFAKLSTRWLSWQSLFLSKRCWSTERSRYSKRLLSVLSNNGEGGGGVGGRSGVTANPVFTVPFGFVFFLNNENGLSAFVQIHRLLQVSFSWAWKHIESAFYRLDVSISTSCKTFSWGGREGEREAWHLKKKTEQSPKKHWKHEMSLFFSFLPLSPRVSAC